MINKKTARLRRSAKTRFKIRDAGAFRLSVHRTPRHMYAQIIDASGSNVLVAASTVEAEVKAALEATGNVDAATRIGALIAKRALEKGVTAVAFDRSGFKYHGRVKALADAARESGLQF